MLCLYVVTVVFEPLANDAAGEHPAAVAAHRAGKIDSHRRKDHSDCRNCQVPDTGSDPRSDTCIGLPMLSDSCIGLATVSDTVERSFERARSPVLISVSTTPAPDRSGSLPR